MDFSVSVKRNEYAIQGFPRFPRSACPFERLCEVQIPEQHEVPIHCLHAIGKNFCTLLAGERASIGKQADVGHSIENK